VHDGGVPHEATLKRVVVSQTARFVECLNSRFHEVDIQLRRVRVSQQRPESLTKASLTGLASGEKRSWRVQASMFLIWNRRMKPEQLILDRNE